MTQLNEVTDSENVIELEKMAARMLENKNKIDAILIITAFKGGHERVEMLGSVEKLMEIHDHSHKSLTLALASVPESKKDIN